MISSGYFEFKQVKMELSWNQPLERRIDAMLLVRYNDHLKGICFNMFELLDVMNNVCSTLEYKVNIIKKKIQTYEEAGWNITFLGGDKKIVLMVKK